ncbi:MAG: PKD domain-containing protein, partial [Bacteroidia bacterium]|nr:PKD domain-containing protein [Bacteroidia bacterium]
TSQTNSTGCTCNGASTVTVTCTAGLFNYTWSNGSQTLNTSVKTNTVTGLCPGTYTVTVSSSCKTTTSVVTISGSTGGITLAANQSNAACFGTANGSATITPAGGSAPYTYTWSNGQTTSSATSLSARNYSVTVTDALGCANVKLITITEPTSISITTTITNPNCATNNSSAAISVTGGIAPYTFNWNNGQIGSTGTGLNAGTYTVTVTDNKGCTRSQNISISSPPPITLNITNSNTCPGANSATAGIIATGGTGSYTYNWSSGQTIAFVYGLGTGVYTVTVTDANGCSGTKTAIVSTYSPINVTIASTPSNCITSGTGTATVSATGGSGTYNYSWAPPVVSNHSSWPNIGQLKSGTYTVIVSDANNCSSVSTVSIGQTPPPVAGFSISPGKVICLGNTVMFTNTSGNPTVNWQLYNYTPPSNFTTSGSGNTFSYTFNTPPGVGIFNIAQSGSVGGCYFSKTDTIAVVNCPPTGPAPAAFGGGCISSGDCTKKLSAGVTGGTAPYTYKWSTGATTADIYPCPTAAGVYTLTVTDAGGFSATTTVAVSILPSSSFTPGPLATVCIGSTVNFVGATSSGATYSWTIYDTPAVSGTSANFSHAFLTAGRYPIFRSATNGSCGTQYRDTVNVINCSGPVVTTVANSVCP